MFPDLANPVQMQVDSKGRLVGGKLEHVPQVGTAASKMNDSLMIFEDTNKDGVADDTRKIFAHVHNPLGFEFWGGGVHRDLGSGSACSSKTPMATIKAGRALSDSAGTWARPTRTMQPTTLVYGPDGGIYWQSGIFLVHNHETPWKQNLNIGGSGMYRFDPSNVCDYATR